MGNTVRHHPSPHSTRERTPSTPSARAYWRRATLASAVGHALFALAAAAPLVLAGQPARAAEARPQDEAARAYSIPAGPLTNVLKRFGLEAGILLSFSTELTNGLHSKGLAGSYTHAGALHALLADSGLEAVRQGNGGYLLVKRPPPAAASTAAEAVLPAVTVKATESTPQHLKSKVGGGALGARSQLETPFSTTVVTQEDLAERQVSKLGDVFALDAAVTDNSGAYSSWASYITVRGLELDWQNAYRIDGQPFLSYAITMPYEHFEQVELLKGASGFMFGFGSPGGLINYVTKKPTDENLVSIAGSYKSNGVWSEAIDLGGRVGSARTFGYRVTAVHEDGKTFNDGEINRKSVSVALDARLTQDLTWDFQSLYQTRRSEGQTPSISAAFLSGGRLPSTVGGDDPKLVSAGQFLDTDFEFYSSGLKYRISPDWIASTSYSHSTSRRSRNEGILYVQNIAGDYNENRSDTRESHRFEQWQAMLQGRVMTAGIEHQLVFGTSWQKQLNNYSSNGVWTLLGTGNLFARNGNAYYTQGDLDLYRAGDITQNAVFASDTVKLTERWSVLAGLRQTRYTKNDYAPDGTTWNDYADRVITPTVALMFKAAPDTMAYVSYVESLEPGKTVGSTYANANRLLDPMISKQYELGIKTEQQRWSATAALFRIERPSEFATVDNFLVLDGLSSYQGLELGVAGRLGAQWLLGGNLMFLDSAYDKGNANIGNRVAGAPRWMATTHVAYQVPQIAGLKLTADAKYTGDVMLNAANTIKVDKHLVLNLGTSYDLSLGGRAVTLRAAVNNVTDERYWEYQYANWIKPADPRTFSVSAKLDF
jgi:iron complex outermembrane receptor protein